MSHQSMVNTLRINHSVALRNAGTAALRDAVIADNHACAEYGPSGHRFAFIRETLDGEEFWECPCGREARNAREADLPLMTEDDPHWDEMVAYAQEFRPRLTTERVIPPHTHVWVETDRRHTDNGEWVKRCTTCDHEV